MEIASARWISDMEMDEDSFLNSLSYSLDHHSESFSSYPYQQPSNDFHIPPTPKVHASSPHERPQKQLMMRHATTPPCKIGLPPSLSSPQIISFGKTTSSDLKDFTTKNEEMMENDFSYLASQGEENSYGIARNYSPFYNARGAYYEKSSTRTPLSAQEHVMAERKRRERLSQRLIALSAIIPGLKKMDKASVLEDATKYLKQLQERVKTLEEEVSRKDTGGVVVIKKSLLLDDETSSSSSFDENSRNQSNKSLPEIEARVSEKFILLKVHCLKREGCVPKILEEVEKLSLCVLDTSVLPFGSCILEITILAQMEEDFNMKSEDFIKNLHRALLGFI